MNNPRIYGNKPFSIALIHGGPGAPGEMAPIARELSRSFGILEPLQTASSVEGQLQELHSILQNHSDFPITLIGHSWGAWLSFLFAARYSSIVKKLILIGSGPFEEKYAVNITVTRLSRLTENERTELDALQELLSNPNIKNENDIFVRFEKLMSKADSFDPLPFESDVLEYQPDIFQSVWKEAKELRQSGKLLKIGNQVQCPVAAIHGDYDPHPAEGVKSPLSKIIKDFRFILLEKCGHNPWIERNAKENFYEILHKELT
ncbi:MAG: alpha/beta hydrolase [Candidatus Marinimicrobia bacterium]|nr:alpha/beta hydrolase [Candidatus Neomarinimicrobiota bacterium]